MGKTVADIDIPSHEPLDEAHNDFFGLPSNPLSVYHTGPAWPLPSGPQAQRVPKEARPVCTHAISSVWHELGEKIYRFFDSIELKWTSIDPVRFAEAGKEPGPLFLWVGVLPSTLTRNRAKHSAVRCKEILLEYEITDVEIAFRESTFTRYAGPQLLNYALSIDPTVDLRIPFTPTLGLQIAPKAFPYIEGTGCLYLCEGGESDRVLLLTARHVVLPPNKYPNEHYHRKNNRIPRIMVMHLGSRAYQNALKAVTSQIYGWDVRADYYKEQLDGLGKHVKDEGEDSKTASERQKFKCKLEKTLARAEASKASVSKFHRDITSLWSMESQRILGHVVYAPPISVGTGDGRFTEDWALVELDRSKFNWDTFQGNVMHIGTFRSISLRSSSLTITSRNKIFALPIHEEDVSSCRDQGQLQVSNLWPNAASRLRQGRRASLSDHAGHKR
jgi:hypothetical protein